MMDRIKQLVAQMIGQIGTQQLGTIYDYDPTTYSARVQIQPTGEITGWLPIGVEWVGNGYGMAIGPNIGDMVRIDPVEGSRQVSLIGKRFYNDTDLPMQVPSGECWMVHSSGSLIKFLNDGTVSISATAINSDGIWNHTGPINATGTITAPNVVGTTNVTFGGKSGIGHTHSDPQGGNTGAPN